jgi:hypothetical protein
MIPLNTLSDAHKNAVVLFVLLAASYGFFYQCGGANQNARLAMTRSLVEDRVLHINRFSATTHDVRIYQARPQDQLRYPGLPVLVYSNKAPGSSFWAVPFWAACWYGLGEVIQTEWIRLTVSQYVTTFFALGIPSAAGLALFFLWLVHVTGRLRASSFVTLALGLGSPFFPYSTMYYSHSLAAVVLFTAFFMAWTLKTRAATSPIKSAWLFLIGFLAGFGVLLEYSACFPALLILIYAGSVVRPWKRVAWMGLGAFITFALLMSYHYRISGHFIYNTYTYLAQTGTGYALKGMREDRFVLPRIQVMAELLLGSQRGLFYMCPWLIMGILGWGSMMRRSLKAEGLLFAGICVSQVVFISGYGTTDYWNGGHSFTSRYLIVMLPFLAAGVAFIRRELIFSTVVLALWSLLAVTASTAVDPQISPYFRDPLFEYIFPHFFQGHFAIGTVPLFALQGFGHNGIAWNVGMLMGFSGHWQLAPLYAMWIAGVLFLMRGKKRSAQHSFVD